MTALHTAPATDQPVSAIAGSGQPVRCSACGFDGTAGGFFRAEGTFPFRRTYCAGCRPPTLAQRRSFWTPIVLCAVAAVLVVMSPRDRISSGAMFWVFLAGVALGSIIAISVHELGHFAAARLLGLEVSSVRIGTGRVVQRRRWGRTTIEIRHYPLSGGGVAFHDIHPHPKKWRHAVVLAGGVLANLVAAGAMIVLSMMVPVVLRTTFRDPVPLGITSMILVGMIWSQLMFTLNLVPRTVRHGHRALASDGRRLVHLFRSKHFPEDTVAACRLLVGRVLLRDRRWVEAEAHFESACRDQPDHAVWISMLLHAAGKAGGSRHAVDRYFEVRDSLVRAEAAGQPVALALANAAWHAALTRDPALLDMADQLSGRAFEMLPAMPEIRATLGAVQVLKGEVASGMALLADALCDADDTDSKIDIAGALAEAHRHYGDAAFAGTVDRYAAHLTSAA